MTNFSVNFVVRPCRVLIFVVYTIWISRAYGELSTYNVIEALCDYVKCGRNY
jgi:hypothetical protein